MQRRLKHLVVLFVLLLVACGTTPSAKWAQANKLFQVAEQTIINMHDKQLISDRDLVKLEPGLIAGRTALDESYTYLPDGGIEFESLLNVAATVTTELERYFLQEAPE